MLVYFTRLGGHCIYNSCLLIYFTIRATELIIASCRHDLSSKLSYALKNWEPGMKRYPVGFLSPPNLYLIFYISIPICP